MHILKAGAAMPAGLLRFAVLPRLPPYELNVPALRESRIQERLSFVHVLVEDYGYEVDRELTITESYPDLSNYTSITPLQMVMSECGNREPVVKYLFEKGSDPNCRVATGQRLWQKRSADCSRTFYIASGRTIIKWEIISLFLQNGARIGFGDDNDERPPIRVVISNALEHKSSRNALPLLAFLLENCLPGALLGEELEEIAEAALTEDVKLVRSGARSGGSERNLKLKCILDMAQGYWQRNPGV
ncbi:hypothetical protein GGR57DRAFT_105992 [Xylariaceae sp. FL1272]|nr:hypothetical protein GGR57DRAFT_105992 [Xylariaceae sp. FL1272]